MALLCLKEDDIPKLSESQAIELELARLRQQLSRYQKVRNLVGIPPKENNFYGRIEDL